MTTPAAGTFNCSEIDSYNLGVSFALLAQGGASTVKEWSTVAPGGSCAMTLQTPTLVTETTSSGLSGPVYFAHGSLTATLASLGFLNVPADGTSGTLSFTW